jgi:aryl-alcohol dehydrogenase-like predicted oxidoreductase
MHNENMQYLDADTGRKISKVGLGTWQFGASEWGYGETYAEREARAIVHRALELGVTLFDTAEIYSSGRGERILGRALAAAGQKPVFLSTKMFPVLPSSSAVRRRAAASAKRLGVSHLDLYQAHWPNPLFGDRAIMRGMRSLQQAGLIGEVGVSNYSLARWRAAEAALGSRVLSNQVQYSLVHRSPERDLLPFAVTQGRIIIAFSPLAQGLLSGRHHGAGRALNQVRSGSPFFRPESMERTSGLITSLREVAAAHAATPAQVALAWVIHHPAVAAIPGASSVEQLESNVAAAELRLADDEYQALRTASALVAATTGPDGDRPDGDFSAKFALKHSAKGARSVAKTVWRDFRESS